MWDDILFLCVLVIHYHPFRKKTHVYSNSHTRDTSKLTLEVYVDHTGRSNERVWRMEEALAILLSEQGKSSCHYYSSITMADASRIAVHRTLEKRPGSKKPQSTIQFHITTAGTDLTVPEVHQAQEDVEKLSYVPFSDLLRKVDTFLKCVTGIFEVCIFAVEYMNLSEIQCFLG